MESRKSVPFKLPELDLIDRARPNESFFNWGINYWAICLNQFLNFRNDLKPFHKMRNK